MASKIILVSMALMVAAASAVPAQVGGGGWGVGAPWGGAAASANPWIPPWIASAPWMPQWVPCDPLAPLGTSCSDCTTRLICTKIGGMKRPCTDPTLPHCDLGQCSATPSVECAPAQPAAAEQAPAA